MKWNYEKDKVPIPCWHTEVFCNEWCHIKLCHILYTFYLGEGGAVPWSWWHKLSYEGSITSEKVGSTHATPELMTQAKLWREYHLGEGE